MAKDWRAHELRYGQRHRALRRQYASLVAAGRAVCARCGGPISAGEPFDLGHVDGGGPLDYSGVEHAACNRATGAHRVEWGTRRTSRAW